MTKLIRNNNPKVDKNLLKLLQYGEEVKPVRNAKGYFVTSYGRVFSGKKLIEYTTIDNQKYYAVAWKELKPRIIRGYYVVNLINDDNIRSNYYIHKLVYEAFNNVVDTLVLNIVHIDKNKLNNHVSNLGVTWRKKRDYQVHRNYIYKMKMQSLL